MKTLFYNACIVTPVDGGTACSGPGQRLVRCYEGGAMLVENGTVQAIGGIADVRRHLGAGHKGEACREVNFDGACVIPGFVDPHTHMCFMARRESEFSLRLAGTSYLDILARGGGILSSVAAVREAGVDELYAATSANARRALATGTTTVEIKSGYGLDTVTELRMLQVIARLGRESALDVVATFMGAHALPAAYKHDPERFVDLVITEMLPAVAEAGLARFCDVFCEKGVFSIEQSRRILLAARDHGLGLKIHADEVNDLGGAGLAAELRAISAEHLLAANDTHLAAMGASGTVAVVLPATAYSLRKPYARARRMVDLGVPVALATDCNPGSCFCESMPFVMGLAVLGMGLTPEEALVGCTLNAAYAIGMADRTGSLELGKYADFLVLDGQSPACIAYHAGGNSIARVYKRGALTACDGQVCE